MSKNEIKNKILLALRGQGIDIRQGKYFVEEESVGELFFHESSIYDAKEVHGKTDCWIGFLDHLFSKLQENKIVECPDQGCENCQELLERR